MEIGQQGRAHSLDMVSCKLLKISGIQEVVSFDDTLAVLITSCGTLHVEGEGLHVTLLDVELGNIALDGSITGLFYPKTKVIGGKGLGRR
jgi:sporulation protein YabP